MTKCVKCGEETEPYGNCGHYTLQEMNGTVKGVMSYDTYTCTNKECPYYSLLQANLEQERKAAKKEQRTPCCGAPISAPVDGSQNRICTECGEFVTGLKSKL